MCAVITGIWLVAVGGRTSTGWSGVSGLTGGSGLIVAGLTGVIGRMGWPGCIRTDGGIFGNPDMGNIGAIPGCTGSGANSNTGEVLG